MRFAILVASVLAIVSDTFVNEEVEPNSTLMGRNVRVITDVRAIAQKTTSTYDIVFRKQDLPNLVMVYVKWNYTTYYPKPRMEDDLVVYPFEFDKEIAKGTEVEMAIYSNWLNATYPYPAELKQADQEQYYMYHGNLYFLSPYASKSIQHLVIMQSEIKPKEYSADLQPIVLKRVAIVYGPYLNVPKLSYKPLKIHFRNVEPDLADIMFERTVQVGYGTGKLHINDFHSLRNQGPKLKGQYSRIDSMLNPSINENHPVVMKLKCDLPPNAESVYVKDFVGNVSTTNWRKNGELEIRPRFPLFGGWKYTWWHGYDVPITQGVESLGNDIYILSVDVHQNIAESPADVAVWKAVLPEGATDIRILNAPWFFEHKIETTFSYFDTIGRPTVVIKQNNFYPFYLTKFRVQYKYTTFASYRKIIVVSSAVLGFVIFIQFLFSMDLSISPKTSANGSLPKPKELPKSLKNMLAKERKALTSIEEATLQFKKDKNKDEFLKKHDNQFAIIESCHVFIADLGAQPEASTDILEILTELKLRKLVLNRHYDAVVDLVSGKSQKDTEKLKAEIAETSAELQSIASKIEKLSE